jgi:hypothetical protein
MFSILSSSTLKVKSSQGYRQNLSTLAIDEGLTLRGLAYLVDYFSLLAK